VNTAGVLKPDTSGHYVSRDKCCFVVAERDNLEAPITQAQFIVSAKTETVFSPSWVILWNPYRQRGPALLRPIVTLHGSPDRFTAGACVIQEIGGDVQSLTPDSHATLRTLRTGGFTRFRIGVRRQGSWFTTSAFEYCTLSFTAGYCTDVPVYSPEEFGTHTTFPAMFGRTPCLIRGGFYKIGMVILEQL